MFSFRSQKFLLSFLRKHVTRASAFTLIELLVVIAVLAILTATVVLIVNPTERLKEARDSTRIQELTSLEQTIQLLTTQNTSLYTGEVLTIYVSIPDSSATCTNLGLPTLPPGYSYACVTSANYKKNRWYRMDSDQFSI